MQRSSADDLKQGTRACPLPMPLVAARITALPALSTVNMRENLLAETSRRDCNGFTAHRSVVAGSATAELCQNGLRTDEVLGAPTAHVAAVTKKKQMAATVGVSALLEDGTRGLASVPDQVTTERLWQTYFKDPTEWWDCRNDKLDDKSPDFINKNTKESLCIHSSYTPKWVKVAPERRNKTGVDGCTRGIDSSGECGIKFAVDFRLRHQNQLSSTALISQHIKSGQPKKALKIYREMREGGLERSSYTMVAALKACSSLQDLETAKEIHTEVRQFGYESNPYVGTMLVDVYVKCGRVLDARRVFESMQHHNVVCWNALILGYVQIKEGGQALQFYTQMQQEGVAPNTQTFIAALKACSTLAALEDRDRVDGKLVKGRSMEHVRDIHSAIEKSNLKSSVVVSTMLLDVYAKCGSLVDARGIFEKMENRDIVAWNAIIFGYAQMEDAGVALKLFAQMQQEGLTPNDRTFVGALKACSTLVSIENLNEADMIIVRKRCLEQVRAIHLQVVKCGCESALFVATMLVDAYAKCGSLVDARRVFERIPHPNVVSWSAMIMGYAQLQHGEEALQLYQRMRQEGVPPNHCTFVAALKACGSLAALEEETEADGKQVKKHSLEQVRSIHSDILKNGLESDLFVGNMLVDVYAKCGSLSDARYIFEKMPRRDVVTWNAMILGYTQMEEGEDALNLYARLEQEGLVPDERTFVAALKACTVLATSEEGNKLQEMVVKARCLEQVRAIHSDVLKRGFGSALFVGTMLVDVYAKCGSLVDARCVFENMPHHDVVSWTAMILGYAQMQQGEVPLELYNQMQQDGVVPNNRTFLGALKACWNLAALEGRDERDGLCLRRQLLEQVRAIHLDMVKRGSETDVLLGNMLLDVYAKCGNLVDARRFFETMPYRDVLTWNGMISGYVQMGEVEEALKLYARMQHEGVPPDDQTFINALKAIIRLAPLEAGEEHDRILLRNHCIEQVKAIHLQMLGSRIEPAVIVWTTLLDVYARYGNLVDARHVFEKMPCHNVISWNCMILRYAEMGEGEEALQLYATMQDEGVSPNELTFVGALKACAVVAGLEKGKEIHAQISGLELEGTGLAVPTTLIDMYGKCGCMESAQQVFDALTTRDVVAWSVLIAGYAHQGESEFVFDLFQRMKRDGIKPDGITFLSLLKVCSHVGLLHDGWKCFEAMSRDYGITPTLAHYTCVIDLLGRSGQVDEAMEMVKTMPFQPDAAVWQTVLCACQKWGNVKLGRQAFDYAVGLDESDGAAYVLMANIYAAADMLEDAKKILALRVKTPGCKKPGQSWWTDKGGMVHEFVAEDAVHSESARIYSKLQDLSVRIGEDG